MDMIYPAQQKLHQKQLHETTTSINRMDTITETTTTTRNNLPAYSSNHHNNNPNPTHENIIKE